MYVNVATGSVMGSSLTIKYSYTWHAAGHFGENTPSKSESAEAPSGRNVFVKQVYFYSFPSQSTSSFIT